MKDVLAALLFGGNFPQFLKYDFYHPNSGGNFPLRTRSIRNYLTFSLPFSHREKFSLK